MGMVVVRGVCGGEGGGRGSGSQYREYFICTGKGVSLFQPISGLELPYIVIRLVDWRCCLLEIKRY